MSANCIFTHQGDQIICGRCGKAYDWPAGMAAPIRECLTALDGPSLLRRANNFAAAVFKQAPLVAAAALTGDEAKAFRSQAEIEAISNTCKACPLFNGDICTHKDCGCPIDTKRDAWWSKIAWKSQHCPDEPPRWK